MPLKYLCFNKTYWNICSEILFYISVGLPYWNGRSAKLQYIPRNMHTVFALLCFVVVIHWLIFPYPSGLLHWHCGNLTIATVPAKQPWWIWINTSCEFIMNDCMTTTKQSTTKPCAYFLGYTVRLWCHNAFDSNIRSCHGPLTRYVKLRVAHAPGMPGTFSPAADFQRSPLVSDPGMHHSTCVTHVPWCMSGSLTCGDGENVPGIPGACASAILRIWKEAHGYIKTISVSYTIPGISYMKMDCKWYRHLTGLHSLTNDNALTLWKSITFNNDICRCNKSVGVRRSKFKKSKGVYFAYIF